MDAKDIKMDNLSPTSPWESSYPIRKTDHLKKAIKILDEQDWMNMEKFLQPQGSQRITLVHLAAYSGNLTILKFAADFGMDLYARDKFDRCALHYGAYQGHLDVVKWLVEQSACAGRPNGKKSSANDQLWLQDSDGMTALDIAKRAGHLDVVKFLMKIRIEEKVCLELSTRYTPDHGASSSGHRTRIEEWTHLKLSVRNPPRRITALKSERRRSLELPKYRGIGDVGSRCYASAREIQVDISDGKHSTDKKEFLENCNINEIHLAAYQGNLNVLKSAAELDTKDNFGRCALDYAAEQGHIEVVKYLLERPGTTTQSSNGRRLSQLLLQDCLGMSALHYAAEQGHIDIVKYLLEFPTAGGTEKSTDEVSLQLSLEDCTGRTPLHLAVEANNVDVVKFLVNAGANVDAHDKRGVPPILMAHCNVPRKDKSKMSRYEEIVDFLISRGASTEYCDPITGWTVLHYAVKLNSQKAAQWLCEYDESLLWARGGSDRMGDTPVHVAVSYKSNEALCILLNILPSWMIDIPNSRGLSPLQVAAFTCNVESVHVLIDRGGNLAKKDHSNNTTIDILSSHQDNVDIVALFTDILNSKIHLWGRNDFNPKVKRFNFVVLDFKVLGPEDEPQMAVVSAMIEALPRRDQIPILQHPLVNAYITLKWLRLCNFFRIRLIVHYLFAVLLSFYAIYLQTKNVASILLWIMFFFAVITFSYNALQFSTGPKRYIKKFENWLYPLCLITSIVVALHHGCTHTMAWWIPYSVSIIVPVVWIHTMLLAGRLPGWVFNTLVFPTALMNFLKVFLIGFLSIIVGFAFSFSVLLHGNNEFNNPWKAFVKSVLMMTGEYEFGDLFGNDTKSIVNNGTIHESEKIYGPIVTRGVFLIFVILTSIVLMNLMIGLAVSDIQGLVKEGDFSRLLKQAEFIADCERITTARIFMSSLVPSSLTNMLKSSIPEVLNGTMFSLMKLPPNFPKSLTEEIYAVGLKNEKREEELLCPNEEDSDVIATESSLPKKVVQQQLRDIEIQRITQDLKTKKHRDSI